MDGLNRSAIPDIRYEALVSRPGDLALVIWLWQSGGIH